ncbi:hypothetical protein [Streptomyces sp. NPDC047990]|uniref:hypothetical protein n=1 Tax=Streptomyces sp. NPDC047990 TaxID=3365496 RepID=UPI0037123437
MALPRNQFGGTADSVAEDITGARVPGATGTVWNGPSAGATQITDLLDSSSAPIAGLVADQNGFVAPFYGPAGVETVWVDFGAGRVALVSSDVGVRLDNHLYGGAPDPHGDRAYSDAQLASHNVTGGVHGIGGTSAVVGTTDVQTLTNKTLSGGTFSGNFNGSPNFTTAPVFNAGFSTGGGSALFNRPSATNPAWRTQATGDTNDRLQATANGNLNWGPGNAAADTVLFREQAGVLVLQGTHRSYKTNTGDSAFYTRLSADTNARWYVMAGGQHNWGDGTNAPDTSLFRDGSNILGTNALLRVYRTVVSDATHSSLLSGDSNARWYVQGDGKQFWGPGNATQDTNLYRSAADTLKTDDAFVVGGDITVGSTTWTSFTPAWTGLGSGSLSTNTGWYKKLGKIVIFEIYGVVSTAGTGSTGVAVGFPTTPYRDGAGANTTRQFVSGYIAGSNGGVIDGLCIMPAFAGDSGTTGATLRRYDGIITQGSNYASGTIITIQGWYREA